MQLPLTSSRFAALHTGRCFCSLLLLFIFTPDVLLAGVEEAKPKRSGKPVILLTGFEPFGKDLPPNPSWEGIRQLDGREWRGHTLICKQLPVVWGEPWKLLQEWSSRYQPVAIFSFGQGEKGFFTLERRASNRRERSKDNRGEYPRREAVVAEGPKTLFASIYCEKLASRLTERGFRTHVSSAAGRYLCEEMLYSLEYLRASRRPEMTVLFCHVPPLGSTFDGKKVTAASVQRFVEALLETWSTLDRQEASSTYLTGVRKPEEARTKDMNEIKEFIQRYFRTWSEQDMKGYDACFLPDACIQFIDARGNLDTSSRANFVANQKDYHRRAPHRAVEVPESIDIRFEAKLARVVVYWKLTAGPRLEYGYDHFTLIKQDGSWHIVNLVFYPSAKKIPD